ncbi:MAG: MFS transporter, partial [Micrococcaceae bacterium]|nr:MFS transporter [Micrococcaceae bacterium]
GLASLTFLNSCNTSIQLSVEPRFRGRVLAIYVMVIQGGTPIGAPLVGWLGTEFGARWSIAAGGLIALAAGLWALQHVRKGKLNKPVFATVEDPQDPQDTRGGGVPTSSGKPTA